MAYVPYKKELIGRFLSLGGEHIVFYYDKDKVIKFPVGPRYLINPAKHCQNLKKYNDVVSKYFSEFLIDKEIIFFKRRGFYPSYVIVEKYIKGRHLREEDLVFEGIKEKFLHLLQKNKEMVKNEGLSLDVIGIWNLVGFTRIKEFANIILEQDTGNIYILDHGIWNIKGGDYIFFVDLFVKWAHRRQSNILDDIIKSIINREH